MFPHETAEYRTARNDLLAAERDLRAQMEKVAALRRQLPPGGEVQDYEFDAPEGKVKLSELFGPHRSLVLYSFMFGPKMEKACPMCASFIDGYEAIARFFTQRAGLAVVARSPIERLRAFAEERGWRDLRLLSSANNTYHPDYLGEKENGSQEPMLNVFTRQDGVIRHFWGSELLYHCEPGQDPRHLDLGSPLWSLLDCLPEGRGDWYPPLKTKDERRETGD